MLGNKWRVNAPTIRCDDWLCDPNSEKNEPMKKPHTKAEKDLLNIALLADIAKEFERRRMKKKAKECWAAFNAAPVEEIVARAGKLAKQKPYACSNCGRRYKTVEATLLHKMRCSQSVRMSDGGREA